MGMDRPFTDTSFPHPIHVLHSPALLQKFIYRVAFSPEGLKTGYNLKREHIKVNKILFLHDFKLFLFQICIS